MNSQSGRKVAVVTGGTAGVGRATVRRLAENGYDVAVVARGLAGLTGAVEDVVTRGGTGLACRADVSDFEAVREAARQTEEELGEIDVWVNCAFAGTLGFVWDTGHEQIRRSTEVTYLGYVHGMLAALELMRPRDRGAIINVSSAMAYRSIPLQAPYCGAKHAIKGFSESVITELEHEKSKVRVGMVQLPGLNTPQFNWNTTQVPQHPMPVPPVYQPEVAARAIAHMADHPRRNMWVGVPTVYTILGERVAPWIIDWYLARTGVSSQQTSRDLPRWGSNLHEPRDETEDRGARGSFGEMAHDSDPVTWMSIHRRGVSVALAAAGTAALGYVLRRT
jgi:NAD(P)-dependent dehydrogenase (short-subunit alcohol dehydrogenase family)